MFARSRLRVVGLVLTLVGAACAPAGGSPTPGGTAPAGTTAVATQAVDKGTVKIAVIAPLTGAQSGDGEEMVRGAQLGAEDLNAAGGCGGYKFEIVSGDTGETPDTASATVRRLASDPDVVAMLAGYATTTNFEIDLMSDLEMPYILSANTAQTEEIVGKDPSKYPTVWSQNPNYDLYNTYPPEWFLQLEADGKVTFRNKKVYMVNSDNPYSTTIANGMTERFKELGWNVVGGDTVPFGTVSDWHVILAKVRAEDPDIVVNTDYLPANGASFMVQFLDQPTQSLLWIQYGPSVPEFTDIAKDKGNGVLYDLLGGGIPGNPRSEMITEKFRAKYGVGIGSYAANLYEEVFVYCEALKKVGDAKKKLEVGTAIGGLEMDIAQGHLKFNQDTHVALAGKDALPLQMYQIQGAERVLLEPVEFKTGDFQLPPWLKQ